MEKNEKPDHITARFDAQLQLLTDAELAALQTQLAAELTRRAATEATPRTAASALDATRAVSDAQLYALGHSDPLPTDPELRAILSTQRVRPRRSRRNG